MQAVHRVSLSVRRGEIVTLVGANGAGKTTTLRAISGLMQPRAGEIHFEGERLDRLAPEQIVERGIVQVPEGRKLFPSAPPARLPEFVNCPRLAPGGAPLASEASTFGRRVIRAPAGYSASVPHITFPVDEAKAWPAFRNDINYMLFVRWL